MKRFVRSLTLAGAAAAATVSAFPATVNTVRRRAEEALLDATSNFQPSTESSFDHMLELSGDAGAPSSTKPHLTFHWNAPRGNTVTCRLVHRAPKAEIDAGWLGVAVYDVPAKGIPAASDQLMVGSQAIIGNVATGDVSKYVLGAKREGPGGVERMETSFQTLIPPPTKIEQFGGDDGHVTTVLTFEKLLLENDSAEIKLSVDGKNTFLYAAGPPPEGEGTLGFHVLRGAFTLDFAEVVRTVEGGGGTGSAAVTETTTTETTGEEASTETTTTEEDGTIPPDATGLETPTEAEPEEEDSPAISTEVDPPPKEDAAVPEEENGAAQDAVPKEEEAAAPEEEEDAAAAEEMEDTTSSTEAADDTPKEEAAAEVPPSDVPPADVPSACKPEDAAYTHTETLTDGLKMHYKLVDSGKALSVKVEYSGLAWLGFGFSPDGQMIGSEAVIGRPDLAAADEEKPMKYQLKGKGTTAVVPMEEAKQTLRDASIVQEGDTTVMKFTKLLSEDGEHPIEATGATNFIWAIGPENILAYHKDKGSITLDLSTCTKPDAAKTKTAGGGAAKGSSKRGMWAAHGVLATLAWALATPMAVTTAWFRTLVPSSWIYIHVFGNVSSFFLTLLAFIIAVVSMSMTEKPLHFSNSHHVVGLAILMLVTFQVMNGFLRPPVEKKDPYAMETTIAGFIKIPSTARDLWKLAHRCAGILLLGTGFWQLQSGMDLFASDFDVGSWKPYFYAYLGIFGAIIMFLKCWMYWEERKARLGVDNMNPDQRRMGSVAIANGVDPDSELVPVQFDIGMQ